MFDAFFAYLHPHTGAGRPKSKGRKRPMPEWDEDEEWPVEAILDKRVATKADKNAAPGDILYLVAWEGWDPSYNSWEPDDNVADDLIEEYEQRVDEAEDEAENDELERAEEVAMEEAAKSADSAVLADTEPAQQNAQDATVAGAPDSSGSAEVCMHPAESTSLASLSEH